MNPCAVLVEGNVVAWFADFDEAAEEWCRENYFGRWVTWEAKPPELIQLTPEEYAEIEREGAELAGRFKEARMAP